MYFEEVGYCGNLKILCFEMVSQLISLEEINEMKKKFVLAGILVLVIALTVFTGTAWADKPEPVGTRIIMYEPPASFPAGEPFYIEHGFINYWYITERVGNVFGKSVMTLEVDGEEIAPDYVTSDWTAYPPDYPFLVAVKLFTFNFPDGLEEGDHTFTRRYFFTCQSYWDLGIDVDCKNPAELIEDTGMIQTVTIPFN